MQRLLYLALIFSISISAESIPLESKYWNILAYKSIPANEVLDTKSGLLIKVASSASPIIYPFKSSATIKSLSVKLHTSGELNLNGLTQGQEGADDFLFRIGLVYSGQKQLSFFEKTFAPTWIKKLHALAKDGQGISHIEFFNLASQSSLLGKSRTHPLSELLKENFIQVSTKKEQTLHFKISSNDISNKKVLALWMSIDGDDTKSNFSITIEELTIEN